MTSKNPARVAAALAVVAAVGFAGAAPAQAVADIVNLPAAPSETAVTCTALNTASVGTTAAFNAAYIDPAIKCINLTADITYSSAAPFTGSVTSLDRSLSIDGNGHTLTFGPAAAYGNRPFYLGNQTEGTPQKTFQLHDINVDYGFDAFLVSGPGEQANGWDIVLDTVDLGGIPGYGSGSPAGRPVSAYLANVFLEGTGDASNIYGRIFPQNLVVEPGADWTLAPAAAGSNEPPIDMSYGLAYGDGDSGNVWVLGTANVEGGAYSAILGFGGIYVGSNGALDATSNYTGYSYGTLTTAATTGGTGQLWVDNGGQLSVTNDGGIAIFAIAGAPLDLRSDPGASVVITGTSDPAWAPGYGIGAITMASSGSSLQFNEPAVLDIKNLGNNNTNNWAISSAYMAPTAFPYAFDIYDAFQVATWDHPTPVAAAPDASYDNATVLSNAAGTAQPGSSPAALVTAWDSTDYRRIFAADTDISNLPLINPVVGLTTLLGFAGVAGIVVVHRRRVSRPVLA
ncbi:MAG: pectate lyase-like adhesive domain-containing protein [Marmoricola sp.]